MTQRLLQWAVISGDLVDSTNLTKDEIDGAMDILHSETRNELSTWGPDENSIAGFGRRGGDGWQVALAEKRYGLRAALYLRAALISKDPSIQSRMAIAASDGTLPISLDPNAGYGPAFTLSGRLLENLPSSTTMAFAEHPAFAAATPLADAISKKWTKAQARAVMPALIPGKQMTQSDIAARYGMTRQAISQAQIAADLPPLLQALDILEATP